uniref:Ig-like domain-containing protein n=1 Tax=Amphiprion percula TaxID=161767 RepID=A0A3P8TI34_AMPPE
MRNFTLVTVLLLHSLGWIAVSVNEYMEVQPGENVTLMCSNYSSFPTQISWFRAVKKSKVACISHMFEASEPTIFCEGFQNGKFEISSNTSTLFLRIKHVDLSDSGLYFCGFYMQEYHVMHEATNLEVQDVPEGSAKLMSVILGALTLFLTIVNVCLAVKIKKLLKGILFLLEYVFTSSFSCLFKTHTQQTETEHSSNNKQQ